MKNRIEPYSPCPCGSGKKYKFCCYLKRDEGSFAGRAQNLLASYSDKELIIIDEEEYEEGYQLLQKGLRVMNSGEYRKAIPIFRQALKRAPMLHSSANNLALCLLVTGQLDEAIQVQEKALESTFMPNPFGLANLASFHYMEGDEFSARRLLKQALDSEIPSEDSCTKVCEVLARFKHHRDILNFVSTTEWGNDPKVCFYTGIAAANLGDRKRAKEDLQRVPPGHARASMAQRYLDHLRDNTTPHTLRGDWPYLLSYEVCPFNISKCATVSEIESWKSRSVLVDFCEAMFNETADDPRIAIQVLSGLKHPSATKLLWDIVKGQFGPDSLRLEALNILKMSDEIGPEQRITIFLKGEQQEIALKGIFLNSEFRFGETLPPKLDKKYGKAIKSMRRKRPAWKLIDEIFSEIMREVPDYYPAQFNYAVALCRRGQRIEAEPILRTLVDKHPEYLFARSALIQMLLRDNETEAAEHLITTMPVLEETHPNAMAIWMVAQAHYYEHIGDHEKAVECVRSAHDIAPDLTAVKAIWKLYAF